MSLQEISLDPRRAWRTFSSSALGETYYEAVHASGLTVLVCPKDFTTAFATLGVMAGSIDRAALPDGTPEPLPGGAAHFLEHKMFEEGDGGDAEDVFSALGAEVNAFTDDDRTAFLFSCTDRFDESLEALLRLVRSFHVTKASMERERGIIAEEIRMNDDSPWECCYGALLEGLYRDHPIREEICGSTASIASLTVDALLRLYRQFYRPDNMVLSVCGRVTPDGVMDIVDRVFPHRRTRRTAARAVIAEPDAVSSPRVTRYAHAPKPLFAVGIKDPDVPEDAQDVLFRDLCMTVLCEMLFSESSPFCDALVADGLVASGLNYNSDIGRGFSFGFFSEESDDPEAIFARFRAYAETLRRDGLPREEFDRAKRILYADYISGFDSSEEISGLLCNYALEGLDLFDFLDAYGRVTLDAVEALFRSAFREEHYVLAVVEPEGGESAQSAQR